MLSNLGNFITSFGSRSRKRVDNVLRESLLEKEQIGRLIEKVSSFTSAADYIPTLVSSFSSIEKAPMIDFFRDVDLRVKSLYLASSSLSVLSSSIENIFGGEIAKLEKDLEFLNKYIDNYAFIAGEDDLYNVNYIENFDNDQNYYEYDYQSPITSIPDRNGFSFLPKEKAYVDSFTGSLKFSSAVEENLIHVLPDEIESIEYDSSFNKQYISSDTGITNLITGNVNNSWLLTVKTPQQMSESIFYREQYKKYDRGTSNFPGAELAVKINFKKQIQCSRIRISPNVGYGLYLVQAVLSDEKINSNFQTNNSANVLLTKALYSENNIDLDFPETQVQSIILFFKQRNYKKTKYTPIQSEINSKLIQKIISSIKQERKKNHDLLQDYVISYFLNNSNKDYILRNKKIYQYDYTKYYPVNKSRRDINILKNIKNNKYPSDLEVSNNLKNSDVLSSMVFSIIAFSLSSRLRFLGINSYVESNLSQNVKGVDSYFSGGIVPVSDSNSSENNLHYFESISSPFAKEDILKLLANVEEQNMYEYMFSIKNISFFETNKSSSTIQQQSSSSVSRSFFVSKKLPLKSKPNSVKMICNYLNKIARYDSSAMPSSSVEFSVSIKDNPSKESDWIPILPSVSGRVPAEILYLEQDKKSARLRFVPRQETIRLFANGEMVPSNSYTVSGSYINYSYNPNYIYVASYEPVNTSAAEEILLYSVLDSKTILSTFSKNGINGEYFSLINYDNSILLSEDPFIDFSKFTNATYNPYNGTVTSSKTTQDKYDYSSYSPIKVIFEDGTTAINITNYLLTDSQNEYFIDDDEYRFVQKGKTLVFNKKTNKPFRVLYQYVPDSFRYRIVFRSLNSTQENYSIDRLIFKFSAEKINPIENIFLRYDNMFNNSII